MTTLNLEDIETTAHHSREIRVSAPKPGKTYTLSVRYHGSSTATNYTSDANGVFSSVDLSLAGEYVLTLILGTENSEKTITIIPDAPESLESAPFFARQYCQNHSLDPLACPDGSERK